MAFIRINPRHLAGYVAVILWSFSATATAIVGRSMPPLLLMSVTSICIFLLFSLYWLISGQSITEKFRMSAHVYALGLYGFGLYTTLYFLAFAYAPPFEASLLNYLWPTFIIIILAAKYRSLPNYVSMAGALMCIIGYYFVLERRLGSGNFDFGIIGYVFAILAAFTWASYSVLTRSIHFSPDRIAIFFLFSGFFALVMHVAVEETNWPRVPFEWIALIFLIIVGLAPMFWDFAMKQDNIKPSVLASYLLPLLSTTILVISGFSFFSKGVLFGGVLIVGGCLVMAFKDRSDQQEKV